MPGTSAWLNYFVSDSGNAASLRELVVPWNEVRTPTAKTRIARDSDDVRTTLGWCGRRSAAPGRRQSSPVDAVTFDGRSLVTAGPGA